MHWTTWGHSIDQHWPTLDNALIKALTNVGQCIDHGGWSMHWPMLVNALIQGGDQFIVQRWSMHPGHACWSTLTNALVQGVDQCIGQCWSMRPGHVCWPMSANALIQGLDQCVGQCWSMLVKAWLLANVGQCVGPGGSSMNSPMLANALANAGPRHCRTLANIDQCYAGGEDAGGGISLAQVNEHGSAKARRVANVVPAQGIPNVF